MTQEIPEWSLMLGNFKHVYQVEGSKGPRISETVVTNDETPHLGSVSWNMSHLSIVVVKN